MAFDESEIEIVFLRVAVSHFVAVEVEVRRHGLGVRPVAEAEALADRHFVAESEAGFYRREAVLVQSKPKTTDARAEREALIESVLHLYERLEHERAFVLGIPTQAPGMNLHIGTEDEDAAGAVQVVENPVVGIEAGYHVGLFVELMMITKIGRNFTLS